MALPLLRVSSCNVVFGFFRRNTSVQTEISNFGRKIGTIGETIFPLTTHGVRVFIKRCFSTWPSKPNTLISNLLRRKMRRWGYEKDLI